MIQKKAIQYKDKFFSPNDIEMSIAEHLDELRQRLLFLTFIFILTTGTSLINLKKLTLILQEPAMGIKFLQLAPGEYFFVSIKIALYSGIIFSCPFAIYQLIMFILPGLTSAEVKIIIPSLLGSIFLFFLGIGFGYNILIPAALQFFIQYPIVQIIIGMLNIVSSRQMLNSWKYIMLSSTIIGAVLTPSTDPFTQILMSAAIFILYLTGTIILIALQK